MKYLLVILFCCPGLILRAATEPIESDTVRIQKTLKEITVKAEKRETKQVDLPVSVSVVEMDEIPLKGSMDIRNLSGLIPNFFMLEYGLKLSTPVFIRGIGTPTANPTVGLYVDGVPVFDKNTYIFDLYDIKQIEVLRGPQGTLQGRNTLGGMINILTNSPTAGFGVSFRAGYGNYNSQNYNLLLNLPFAHNLYNKFFFAYSSSDGFFKNKWNGEKVDKNKGYTFRYQGRWLPGRNWDIKFGVNYYKTEDGGYGYYFPDSLRREHYKVSYNSPSSYKRDLVTSYVNIRKKFKQALLNTVTSYTYYDDMQKTDQDYSDLDIYYNEKPSHQHLVTQEINLQSQNTRRWDWIIGTFGFYKDLTNDLTTNYQSQKNIVQIQMPGMPRPIPVLASYLQDIYHNNTRTYGLAGYGQITLKNIWPGLYITAGIRYDAEKNQVDYEDAQIRTKNSKDTSFRDSKVTREWLPKFSILQKFNDQMSAYISVSKGYKAGGYNIVLNMMRDNLSYDSDYTWNYEVGYKYFSKSRNFRLNTSVFYIDWTDQQLFQMEMNAAIIKNGGNAYSTGAEMDMQWRFLPDFTYTLSAGYTHAKYSDYSGKTVMPPVEYDYKGNHLPMVPEFTFNTGLTYSKNLKGAFLTHLNIATNVTGIGCQYFDDANTEALKQKPYFLWNASCIFSTRHFDLEIWAKNMLNTHYFANMLASPMSIVSESMKYLGQSGSPATFGAALSFNL